jgi:hypothetical protein
MTITRCSPPSLQGMGARAQPVASVPNFGAGQTFANTTIAPSPAQE